MSRFMNFIYFNGIVYIAYMIVDKVFTYFNLYSNPELGNDLMVMPTSTDMILIGVNVILSSICGFYILYKIKNYYS